MRKPPSPEYIELKAFFRFIAERFFASIPIEPEHHPIAVLESQERTAPARAFSSLRMAVNDCIELSSHMPQIEVAALDAELRSLGLLSLSKVRHRYSRKFAAILKRGEIRNSVEYYIVQGVLADQALNVGPSEGKKLEELAAAFERNAL